MLDQTGSAGRKFVRSVNYIDLARTYWDAIRGVRAMPSRADLDPADIPQLLPFTVLVEVLLNPLDFRFRLLGTEIDCITMRNYRGLRFSELPHMTQGSKIWSNYERVCNECTPIITPVDYVGNNDRVKRITDALFPLSSDGKVVDMIWGILEIGREDKKEN